MIDNKINQILKLLNIKEKSGRLDVLIRNILQENSGSIFDSQLDEFNIFFNNVKLKTLNIVKDYVNVVNSNVNLDENFIDDYVSDTNTKYYKSLIQQLFKISIYMLLHDPILTLNIDGYNNRKLTYLYYNKNDLMNIEGFGNENTPCVVILQPPIIGKKNYAYQGIKPIVYMIPKASEFIKEEAEKNATIALNLANIAIENRKSQVRIEEFSSTKEIFGFGNTFGAGFGLKTLSQSVELNDLPKQSNDEKEKKNVKDNIGVNDRSISIKEIKNNNNSSLTNKTNTFSHNVSHSHDHSIQSNITEKKEEKTSDFNFPFSKPENKKKKIITQNYFLNTESANKDKGIIIN